MADPAYRGHGFIPLTADQAAEIYREICSALEKPDVLPPGIEMKLADLKKNFASILSYHVDDPNSQQRRLLSVVRECEAALAAAGRLSPKTN